MKLPGVEGHEVQLACGLATVDIPLYSPNIGQCQLHLSPGLLAELGVAW